MEQPDAEERQRLAEALRRPLPEIPSRYFYDDRGSHLFEQITRVPEYYPTRTELRILEVHASDFARRARPTELVELGSGAGRKIRLLLDATDAAGAGGLVTMVDINRSVVDASVHALSRDYPEWVVRGAVGDFERDLSLLGPDEGGRRWFVFLAGTVGNLPPEAARRLFADLADRVGPAGGVLLGIDLVKDTRVLEQAYNDAEGVTAAFNLNVLRVVNRRFGADFDLDAFEHRAFYDPDNGWIEMRVRARRDTTVHLGDVVLDFAAGDEVRTEISVKYTRDRLEAVLAGSGLVVDAWYTDPERLFADVMLARADHA